MGVANTPHATIKNVIVEVLSTTDFYNSVLPKSDGMLSSVIPCSSIVAAKHEVKRCWNVPGIRKSVGSMNVFLQKRRPKSPSTLLNMAWPLRFDTLRKCTQHVWWNQLSWKFYSRNSFSYSFSEVLILESFKLYSRWIVKQNIIKSELWKSA